MNYQWTDDRSKRLTELVELGTSFANVAKELGCTRNAAIGKAHRLGLHGPKVEVDPGKPRLEPRIRIRKRIPTLVPVAIPVPPPVIDGEIAFLDLQPGGCRYPCNNGLFCGHPKVHKAYCGYHASICYEKSS